MRERDLFSKFVKKGKFSLDDIENLKDTLSLNDNQLIRKTFKFLNNEIASLEYTTFYIDNILNSTTLLSQISNYVNFNEDEVIINRKRIKKAREAILSYAYKLHNDKLLSAANKLDEIILDKSVNLADLTRLLKKLIDRKEDINIIKKLLNTNKGVLISEKNELFDYIYNKALISLQNNTADIYYYIALLKIFYSSNIDKIKHMKELNQISDETNSFANEIYYILLGQRRLLDPNDVLKKYGVITEFNTININTNKKNVLTNEFVFTIDPDGTYLRDDALSIKKDGNNYVVGIHISDPTYIVEPNSQLDYQAKNNFTCAYMPEYSTRILPYNIEKSTSLDKNKSRNVISMYVTLNNNGDILDYYIIKDYLKINENLTNTQGDLLLNYYDSEISDKLLQLYDVAGLLQTHNSKKYVYWDKKENDSLDKEITKHKSDKIINELMVLYNNLIATIACEQAIPFVYRTQNNAYLENLVNKMNITIDDEANKVIKNIYLKSRYSNIPLFHNGLNLKMYSHSTSALRRYPDLYNQFLLHQFYFNDLDFNFDSKNHEELINYFNQRSTEIDLMKSEYIRSLKIKGN